MVYFMYIRLMKKVVKVVNKESAGFDAAFWAIQSSEERLKALEQLRTQQLTINGIRQRIQRICRVVERS